VKSGEYMGRGSHAQGRLVYITPTPKGTSARRNEEIKKEKVPTNTARQSQGEKGVLPNFESGGPRMPIGQIAAERSVETGRRKCRVMFRGGFDRKGR